MPVDVVKATGADVRSPGRYKDTKQPKVPPLGSAPRGFSEGEREAWELFREELPWLAKSDRALVEVAARIRAELQIDPTLKAMAQLRLVLSSMGATPVDRMKVSAPNEEPDDPADKFLN